MKKINLILADNFNDLNRAVVSKINLKDLSLKNIVIIPDRYSLLCEKLIFDVLKTDVVFNVEVMGLTRFANMIFRLAGIEVETVNKQECVLLVNVAMHNVKPKLTCFVGEINKGICEEILHTITQFKANQITPFELEASLENKKGYVKQKLIDIFLIYQEYERLLGDRLDGASMIAKLTQCFGNADLQNLNLFYVNFDSFSSNWYQMFKVLAEKVNNVYVGAIKQNNQENGYIFEQDVYQKMIKFSKEKHFDLEVEEFPNTLDDYRNHIHKNLFTSGNDVMNGADFIEIYEAENKQKEIVNLAKKIKFLIKENGVKFNQIQVVCGDLENYQEEIKKVFKEFGFWFHIDDAKPLIEVKTVEFLLNYLKIIAEKFDKNTVENFVISPFFEMEKSQKDMLLEELRKTDGYSIFNKNSIFTSEESPWKNQYFDGGFEVYKTKEIVEKIKNIAKNIKIFEKKPRIL